MRSCVRLPNAPGAPLPPELAGDEVRFPEALVRLLVEAHTRPGGVVLDPFSGYGTVPAVAEALGREGYGLELDAGRHAYGAARLRCPGRLVRGDARQLATYGFPLVDLCLTGIPFCTLDETADPLTWYAAPGGGYGAYLADLQAVFRHVGALLRPGPPPWWRWPTCASPAERAR